MGRKRNRGGGFFGQILDRLTRAHAHSSFCTTETCIDMAMPNECPNYPMHYKNMISLYKTQATFVVHEATTQIKDALGNMQAPCKRTGKRRTTAELFSRFTRQRAFPILAPMPTEPSDTRNTWGGVPGSDHRKNMREVGKRYSQVSVQFNYQKHVSSEADKQRYANISRGGCVVLLRPDTVDGTVYLGLSTGAEWSGRGEQVTLTFNVCACVDNAIAKFGEQWLCEEVTSILSLKRMFEVCEARPKCTFGHLLLGWKKSKHTILTSSSDEMTDDTHTTPEGGTTPVMFGPEPHPDRMKPPSPLVEYGPEPRPKRAKIEWVGYEPWRLSLNEQRLIMLNNAMDKLITAEASGDVDETHRAKKEVAEWRATIDRTGGDDEAHSQAEPDDSWEEPDDVSLSPLSDDPASDHEVNNNMGLSEADDYQFDLAFPRHFDALNQSQKLAINACIRMSPDAPMPKSVVLLQGPPGTGKTKTIVSLLCLFNEHKDCPNVAVCASTNKAVHVVMNTFLNALKSDQTSFSSQKLVLVGVDERIPDELRPYYLYDGHERYNTNMSLFQNYAKILLALVQANGFEPPAGRQPESSVVDRVLEVVGHLNSSDMHSSFLFVAQNLAIPLLSSLVIRINDLLTRMAAAAEAFVALGKLHIEPFMAKLKPLAVAIQQCAHEWPKENVSSDAVEAILLREAQFRFCTLSTAGSATIKRAKSVDVLIVDEAAQAIEAETLIALSMRPKQCILVGDPCQLSAVLQSQEAVRRGFDQSLMSRLMGAQGANDRALPCYLLAQQYRMRPEISSWPSARFYDSKVADAPTVCTPEWNIPFVRNEQPWLRPLAFLNCAKGREERERGKSYRNVAEAMQVERLLQGLKGVRNVIVITFYAAQVIAIKQCLGRSGIRGRRVHTVDSFQGSESDVVIVSFVRTARNVGFLSDCRRLNVALTRAKFSLLLVGNYDALSTCDSDDIRSLMEHVRSNGCVLRA